MMNSEVLVLIACESLWWHEQQHFTKIVPAFREVLFYGWTVWEPYINGSWSLNRSPSFCSQNSVWPRFVFEAWLLFRHSWILWAGNSAKWSLLKLLFFIIFTADSVCRDGDVTNSFQLLLWQLTRNISHWCWWLRHGFCWFSVVAKHLICCSSAVESPVVVPSPGEVFANDDSVISGDTTADSVRVHVRCVCLHFHFHVCLF